MVNSHGDEAMAILQAALDELDDLTLVAASFALSAL